MWPFKTKSTKPQPVITDLPVKKCDEPDDSKCLQIVDDYLKLLPEEGDWADSELLDRLTKLGHNKILSWYVIGMVPIMAGRCMLGDTGVKFSYAVVLYDENGKPTEPVRFTDFAVYRCVRKRLQEVKGHRNFKMLAMRGCEVQCVNRMVEAGSNPKDLVLVEPGFLYPG